MAAPPDALTLKDWLIAGGWLLTVLGWLVSNLQANSRERRKEARAEVDACCDLIAELLDDARAYYLKPGTDADALPKASDIKFKMLRLLTRVERLERKAGTSDAVTHGGDLMDSITGGDFEQHTRLARVPTDPLFNRIESASHFLMDSLEESFAKAFP